MTPLPVCPLAPSVCVCLQSRESKYSPPSSAVSTSSSSSSEDEGAGQKTDTSDLLEEGYLASEGTTLADDAAVAAVTI